MVLDALREKGMGVSVGECLNLNMAFRRERKRQKVSFGPGSIEFEAGYETKNCVELRDK